MQTIYNLMQEKAVVGQLIDAGDARTTWKISATAMESLPFGRGMVVKDGDYINGYKMRLPSISDCYVGENQKPYAKITAVSERDLQKTTGRYEKHDTVSGVIFGKIWVETEEEITQEDIDGNVWIRVDGAKEKHKIVLDDDLIDGNVISATVNGVVCSQAFDTSHDITMTKFAEKVAACPGIESAELDGDDNYELTITADTMGEHITITDVSITGGASQAGISLVQVNFGIPASDRGKFRKSEDTLNPNTTAICNGVMWLAPHAKGKAPVLLMVFAG